MDDADWLAERFEAQRPRLRAVAYRMLGLAGAVRAPGGRPRVAYIFSVADGTITAVDRVANRDRLAELNVVVLDG
jgi:hypothetical protein